MSKKQITFTDVMIRKLKAENKKYIRSEGNGFTIRVMPSGSKTWMYIYKIGDVRRELPLGMYPDITLESARRRFEELRNKVKNGIDPKAESNQAAEDHKRHPTISILVDEYLSKHAMLKKSSWKEDERILRKDILPTWGNRKAKEITRRDVMLLLESMQGRGDGIITNTFKIIRRMFRFAVKQEIITVTPCYGFEKGEELPRPVSKERNLSEPEIKVFWNGISKCAMSVDIQDILKMILLTGQRPGEVASMHVNDIDGRWWEFTPKETIITKQIPRKQRIYLTDLALAIIGEPKEGYIFKCVTDETRHTTERAISAALRRNISTHKVKSKTKEKTTPIRKKKPFVVSPEKKMSIEKFTPHDLRRTCATMLSSIGFSDEIVDSVLAHLKKGEIRTYNQNKYDAEKQLALVAWEQKLISITKA